MLCIWLRSRICSIERVTFHTFYLLVFIIFMTTLYCILKPTPFPTTGALLATIWTIIVLLLTCLFAIFSRKENCFLLRETIRTILFIWVLLIVPVFYESTNQVARYRYSEHGPALLHDSTLVRADDFFLGWLFPLGQIGLYLDTDTVMGVTTLLGRFYSELLQLMYVSYYFWGNGLGAWLLFVYLYKGLYKQQTLQYTLAQQRRLLQMFACAWITGFLSAFALNLLVPAVSPRIYLADLYKNEIRGLWLCSIFRSALTSAASGTFSAFPSGHCGQSWLVPLLAHRIGYARFRDVSGCAAALISLATMVQRYHYFVDFLASFVLVLAGAWMGQFHSEEAFKRCINGSERRVREKNGAMTPRFGAQPLKEDDEVPLIEVIVKPKQTIDEQIRKQSLSYSKFIDHAPESMSPIQIENGNHLQSIDTSLNTSIDIHSPETLNARQTSRASRAN